MSKALLPSLAVLFAGLAAPGAAGPNQTVTGPEADYWVSAATTSGLAGMMGSGGRPSMGAIMGMALSGGPNQGPSHSLLLQLGSRLAPQGPPQADHLPPPGLNGGAPLPLVTPQPAAPAPSGGREGSDQVDRFRQQRPDGRILIYWGCGEHAPPNQPIVVEFASLANDPQAMARLGRAMGGMQVSEQNPPSPTRWTTYGEWPNARSGGPPTGSLIGPHQVHGDYSPDIAFTLGPDQDFMGPIKLDTANRLPSGAVELRWGDVAEARAFYATVMGAGADKTMVLWSSSTPGPGGMVAPSYLTNGDIRRLTTDGYLMNSDAHTCAVPAEVVQAARSGMTNMTAYGGEASFAYPERPADPRIPWHIKWTVKVRYRSATMGMLGQSMPSSDRPRRPGFPGLPIPHF